MKSHMKFILKSIVFILLLSIVLCGLSTLFRQKNYRGSWQTSRTFKDFYSMDKDSIDVLFWAAVILFLHFRHKNCITIMELRVII